MVDNDIFEVDENPRHAYICYYNESDIDNLKKFLSELLFGTELMEVG